MYFNMQILQHNYTVRYMKSQLLYPLILKMFYLVFMCVYITLILYYINIFKLCLICYL